MKQNYPVCPCKRVKCERHGDCAACRTHHASLKGDSPPACDRIRRRAKARARRRAERGE